MTLPILIAGGGIAGLATAHAIARKDFPVHVFEQASEFREVGAGIQLGPNIFRALDRLGLRVPCWPTTSPARHGNALRALW